MPKATKIELDERINYIIELILSGVVQRRFILQNVIKKYNICESQVDKDVKVAREQIKEILDFDKPQKKAEIEARYNFLFLKNLKIQDYRECRSLLDSLCKLSGLNEVQKLDVTSGGEPIKQTPITVINNGKDLNLDI